MGKDAEYLDWKIAQTQVQKRNEKWDKNRRWGTGEMQVKEKVK